MNQSLAMSMSSLDSFSVPAGQYDSKAPAKPIMRRLVWPATAWQYISVRKDRILTQSAGMALAESES